MAFIVQRTYKEVTTFLGEHKANTKGFTCRELVWALSQFGLFYFYKHINYRNRKLVYQEGVVVFIRRCKKYPVGHYLAHYHNLWMDPWINFLQNRNSAQAKSGFRKKLPGNPIYALIPYTQGK